MSMAPLSVYGETVRWGVPLGKGMGMVDTLWEGLTDAHAQTPMGKTAENLAADYGGLFAGHVERVGRLARSFGWSHTVHHTDKLASQALSALYVHLSESGGN